MSRSTRRLATAVPAATPAAARILLRDGLLRGDAVAGGRGAARAARLTSRARRLGRRASRRDLNGERDEPADDERRRRCRDGDAPRDGASPAAEVERLVPAAVELGDEVAELAAERRRSRRRPARRAPRRPVLHAIRSFAHRTFSCERAPRGVERLPHALAPSPTARPPSRSRARPPRRRARPPSPGRTPASIQREDDRGEEELQGQERADARDAEAARHPDLRAEVGLQLRLRELDLLAARAGSPSARARVTRSLVARARSGSTRAAARRPRRARPRSNRPVPSIAAPPPRADCRRRAPLETQRVAARASRPAHRPARPRPHRGLAAP